MVRSRILFVVMICVLVVSGGLTAADVPTSAPSVGELVVEKAGGDTYFRVSLNWPAEGVPQDYADFKLKSGIPRGAGKSNWPAEALALIPQGETAWGVCPWYPEPREVAPEVAWLELRVLNSLPTPTVFVGKLHGLGRERFLLRCPTPQGNWAYLPVGIDFDKAGEGHDLAKVWLEAQADFMAIQCTASGGSFFTYARERLRSRLGRVVQSRPAPEWMTRPDSTERMYEITTGAIALQESLQLDRMRNPAAEAGARTIPVQQIEGVTVQSHPWKEMIGDRKPEIEPVAALVPADQYYIRFGTTQGLADFLDFADTWAGSVLGFMELSGQDFGAKQKIENQICLKTSWLSKLLGPLVIDSLVLTGSDPYLREGSDLSVIFQVKARPVFEAAVNRYIQEARQAHKDLQAAKEEISGVKVESFTTPDAVVRCYRAWLGDYCVYSNSPAAIRRIIEAKQGHRPPLAESLDFVYMRTLYPLNAPQESGFVFLSDPFIRALVGPRLRIAEKRRIEAATSLELVKNAALLYLWEHQDRRVPTLDALYSGKYLSPELLRTEPGDHVSWDPAAFTARSERYGRSGFLTPLVELPVDQVTAGEKAGYETFRERYQSYWRRYFDPIGIRVTAGKNIGLSLTILPLIDQSQYRDMQRELGGRPAELGPDRTTEASILRLAAHLNPESPTLRQIQTMGLSMLPQDMPGNRQAAVEWIGERVQFWIEDSEALLPVVREEKYASVFKVPIVLGVEVKNPLGLMAFLTGVQGFVQVSAPNTVVFDLTPPYKGFAFTRVRPAPEGLSSAGGDDAEIWSHAAIYYGKIGKWLYVSTSLDALHRIVDHAPATQPADTQAGTVTAPVTTATSGPAGESLRGHVALSFDFDRAVKSRQLLFFWLGKQAWEAENVHLNNLWFVARTVGLGPRALVPPEQVLGFSVDSVLGNRYTYDPARDEVVGTATGSLWNPVSVFGNVPSGSPLDRLLDRTLGLSACLTFTKDGLRSEVSIRRAGK